MAGINGLNVTALQLGMVSDISSKLNQLILYTFFPTKSISFESAKTPPTEHYIFDSGATNAFYQPSTTLAWKIPG